MKIIATVSPDTPMLTDVDIIRINASFGTFGDMNKLFDRHIYAPIMFDLPMDRKKYRTNEYSTMVLGRFMVLRDIKYVAISYAKSASDTMVMDRVVSAFIVPKIECIEGVLNFNSILEHADAIMIDRADLRTVIRTNDDFIKLQKEIIKQCRKVNIPVMLAGDILDITTNTINPEIKTLGLNDNDYIVLSEETAMGVNAQANIDRIRNE